MTVRQIAEEYDINQDEFEEFIRSNGLAFSSGIFSGMTIEDSLVKQYVEQFLAPPEPEPLSEEERKYEEEIKKRQEEAARLKMQRDKEIAKVMVTSAPGFEGYKIVKYSDLISCEESIALNRSSSLYLYNELKHCMGFIRRNAQRSLQEAALNLNCNALVNVDFDYITIAPETANITGGTTYEPYAVCVSARGNAVEVEKKD